MKLIQKHSFLLALIFGVAACGAKKAGNPQEGNSNLTIIGDTNVFMDFGTVQTLTVRYHTNDDKPLAGQVDFRIVGAGQGASISKSFGVTNAEGVVQLQLTSSSTDATFQIEASAEYAAPTSWTIAVSDGALPSLDPTGRFALDSSFDVVSGLDNGFGDALNDFIDMTDDPNDPATWIIDKILEETDVSEDVVAIIGLFRGVIDAEVNELLLNRVSIVADIAEIGEMIGDVARNFGINSNLDIRRVGQNDVDSSQYAAWHEVTGANFEIRGESYQFSMTDMNAEVIRAEGIPITTNADNRIQIGEHPMPISYGSILVIALEEVIIPLFDDEATSLEQYLLNTISCESVGEGIEQRIGGSESFYESLCEIALRAAANIIIGEIRDIDDDGVTFTMEGTARPRDTNGDRKADRLSQGTWTGVIDYDGTEAPLEEEKNTFTGSRIAN